VTNLLPGKTFASIFFVGFDFLFFSTN